MLMRGGFLETGPGAPTAGVEKRWRLLAELTGDIGSVVTVCCLSLAGGAASVVDVSGIWLETHLRFWCQLVDRKSLCRSSRMLDTLLGRGFSSKCKSWIKVTRTRIDMIRRKREAMQRFLKKDVADLLVNGLDINAFGKVEGLLKELMLSWCYDFVDQSCDCVHRHLALMQKHSECPEECREAVSSLMFAAARFSDLPELRDLRNIFQEKYGNFVDHFVNKEFAENLSSEPPTREKKIQLMQDIASEFSIGWDSRTFEQTMSKPSASVPEKLKKIGSLNAIEDKQKFPNDKDAILRRYKSDVPSWERHEANDKGHKLHSDRGENHANNLYQPRNGREDHDIPLQGRQELTPDRHKLSTGKNAASETVRLGISSHGKPHKGIDGVNNFYYSGESTVCKREDQEILSHGKSVSSTSHADQMIKSDGRATEHNTGQSIREVEGDEKSYYNGAIRPPYLKPPKASKHGTSKGSKHAPLDPSTHKRASAGEKADWIQTGSDHRDHERRFFGSEKLKGHHDHEQQVAGSVRMNNQHDKYFQHQDGLIDDPKPKTRSSRRRHSRSPSSRSDAAGNHRLERIQGGSDRSDHERQVFGSEKLKGHHDQGAGPARMKSYQHQDDLADDPMTKKRSSRRRHSRSSSCHNDFGNFQATEAPKDNSTRNREGANHRSERNQGGTYFPDHERQYVGPVGHGPENGYYYQVDTVDDPLPRPRSLRRRHSKSLSHNDSDHTDGAGIVKRHSSGRRRENSRQGMQILLKEGQYGMDEEERIIDRLLLHYSKKPTAYEPGKERRKSKAHPSNPSGEPPENETKDEHAGVKPEVVPTTARSVSLPREQRATPEAPKAFARTISFQPEVLSQAPHVHPKLPDYDDLAARFAALRGR